MLRIFCVFLLFSDILSIDRPVIGIVTLPLDNGRNYNKYSYIASSYNKWVESGGGDAVPIFFDYNHDEIVKIFSKINGILFTGGGGVNLRSGDQYFDTLKVILGLAQTANSKGDFFPIFGTCLGFEAISILISKNESILTSTDAHNLSLPLEFTKAVNESKMFAAFPNEIQEIYSKEAITINQHSWGVATESFWESHELSKFFNLISVNKDRNGKEFVSTIEGNPNEGYDWLNAVQWHPEKPIWENKPHGGLNHGLNSMLGNIIASIYFVDLARKSNHKFASEKEKREYLMYGYQESDNEIYCQGQNPSDYFIQKFVFEKRHRNSLDDMYNLLIIFGILGVILLLVLFCIVPLGISYYVKKKCDKRGVTQIFESDEEGEERGNTQGEYDKMEDFS